MNQKPLFLAVALTALLVIGGAFWMMQKRQAATNQSVTTDPVVETPVQAEPEQDFSPQHITPIPGSNQVWYEIPEMGIKLLLPKEGAEDTVYKYYAIDKAVIVTTDPKTRNEEWVENTSGVKLSSKQVLDYNQQCHSPLCGTDAFDFSIGKIPGVYQNHPLAFGSKFIKQFKDFYLITGASPQAVPFVNKEEEKRFYEAVQFPKVPPLIEMHIEVLE